MNTDQLNRFAELFCHIGSFSKGNLRRQCYIIFISLITILINLDYNQSSIIFDDSVDSQPQHEQEYQKQPIIDHRKQQLYVTYDMDSLPNYSDLMDSSSSSQSSSQPISSAPAPTAAASSSTSDSLTPTSPISSNNGPSSNVLGLKPSETAVNLIKNSIQNAVGQRQQNPNGIQIDGNMNIDGGGNNNNNNRPGNTNQPGLSGFITIDSGNATTPNAFAYWPVIFAALKTGSVKFGAAGLKLLKLIAWKKIYKMHHPSTAEIVVEHEPSRKKSRRHADMSLSGDRKKSSKLSGAFGPYNNYGYHGGTGFMSSSGSSNYPRTTKYYSTGDEADGITDYGEYLQGRHYTTSGATRPTNRHVRGAKSLGGQIGGGNWYAAEASSANAMGMQPSSNGAHGFVGPNGWPLPSEYMNMMFHNNIFDNSAAMAVQNAVKLPATDLMSVYGDNPAYGTDWMMSSQGESIDDSYGGMTGWDGGSQQADSGPSSQSSSSSSTGSEDSNSDKEGKGKTLSNSNSDGD